MKMTFNLTSHYILTISSVSIDNSRFKQFLIDTYHEELVVSETSELRNVVPYLELLIDISNGDLACSMFDKRGAFDFHIVNFPDFTGNIPTVPAFGTCMSQSIRYSRACHNDDNFSSRHSMLADRIFSQGCSVRKLMRTFTKNMFSSGLV